ncbi:MAG TPA: hypothetical protein VK116_13265, partial [Planctomycetota bacterium]|nr:hypothetical protein [Planctomycetota bacterium]
MSDFDAARSATEREDADRARVAERRHGMERDGPSTWRELPVIDAERGAGSESAPRTASELRQRLLRAMLRTVGDYGLIADGDRILVAVSGGKDSATL